jgi:hypothetical protein
LHESLFAERIADLQCRAIRYCFVQKKKGALYDQKPQSGKPAPFDHMMFVILMISLLWPRADRRLTYRPPLEEADEGASKRIADALAAIAALKSEPHGW